MQKSRDQTIQKDKPSTLRSWALFDWANSAFALVIAVAIFPPYFSSVTEEYIQIGASDISNSSLYAWSLSCAYILIALFSPLLSGIADFGGRRKAFLRFFTVLGGISCILMYFFYAPEQWWFGLLLFVTSTIGFAGGLVFYNSYLPLIVSTEKMDSLSARGFAYGYIGSVLLLIVCLIIVNFGASIGLGEKNQAVRLSFVLVGVWWIIFGFISFRGLPKDQKVGKVSDLFSSGFREIKKVGAKVLDSLRLKRFLTAFFFYSSGVQTVLYLAATLAEKELGFGQKELILLILILQIVAIGGAYLFSYISKRSSNKLSLIIMLIIWVFICFMAYLTASKTVFYILSGGVGLVMGGIQSLSRSTYSKFIEGSKERVTSYFSFYDILEKVSIVCGTLVFGLIDQLTGSMKNGVLFLSVFFFIGLIVLLRTPFRLKG